MNLQERIAVLLELGKYMAGEAEEWRKAKDKAFADNNWFITDFVNLAIQTIVKNYLQAPALQALAHQYGLPEKNEAPQKIGLVLAGNVPLVGFHDVLCVFLSGHFAFIKPSTKDEALISHLIKKVKEWHPQLDAYFSISTLIKGCDAYIATGSNNSARYFDYYFSKYPNIIRKNRTSVAILTGSETGAELEKLADDVHLYFGLGCRNVTKLYVPEDYDFIPLLQSFRKYAYFSNHHKYKNNYDYQLAVQILNNRYYMTNETVLLIEESSPYSPISQVHYEYYRDKKELEKGVVDNEAIQCIVGEGHVPFGEAQCPALDTFADGVDTMRFLKELKRGEKNYENLSK